METPKNLLNNNQSAQKQLASTPEKKMLPEGEGGGKKWWMLVLGFILIVVLFWVFWGKDSDDVAPKNEENNASVTEENNTANIEVTEKPPVNTSVGSKEAVVSGNNKVSVKDQPAGSVVEVEGLELSVVAWVAVHEERNGGLGNILGARRFEPGIHLGEVELLRNTTAGGVYHAVLYKDNGDRQFDKATDQLMKNDSGVVIESVFKAQ